MVENFFTTDELQACRNDIDRMVDHLANKLYDAGKIKSVFLVLLAFLNHS